MEMWRDSFYGWNVVIKGYMLFRRDQKGVVVELPFVNEATLAMC